MAAILSVNVVDEVCGTDRMLVNFVDEYPRG